MGCGCGGKSPSNVSLKPMFGGEKEKSPQPKAPSPGIIKNLIKAGSTQPNKLKWLKDGVKGIAKAVAGDTLYTPEEIKVNRDICRLCPFSTKFTNPDDPKDPEPRLTSRSQCMAIDPKTGSVCGCLIIAKTVSDVCPIGKFAPTKLTINNQEPKIAPEPPL